MGIGPQHGLAEVGLWAGWLAGWLDGWMDGRMIASEAVRSAYVLPGGDDEDGWSWLEAQRGEADSGITTEAGEQQALRARWINPDEGDDIAASKFLCGGLVVAA